MTATSTACPYCRNPIAPGSRFCASCGNEVSGVRTASDPAVRTVPIQSDPAVDMLGAMLTEATLGEYDVYGELGRGGMAAVYLGLDLALNRKVALKTMLPELVQKEGMVARFKREAQTAAALNHPHIIQIHTVKQSKNLVYFVMKFIEGRSLESVINEKGRVPLKMAQTILSQVGAALDYAHMKHVVHRDIKPANIMIDEDGWAIVTDFGIAKVQEAQVLTATGTAIGTPHYMSPEQFHNQAVTGASDQYSLGVVLYEMLTGKKPFDGTTYAEIITQHLFHDVPDLREIIPDVPPHVDDVVKKMMAKEPSDRYPDLDAAIHALGVLPTKKDTDAVRTQMVSLAKSGPQQSVRMSIPMSPVPVQKKPAVERPAFAPTVAKPKERTSPRAEARRGGRRQWIGIAGVVLGALGAVGLYTTFVNPSVSEQPPGVTPQGNQDPNVGSVAAPPVDSVRIRDSIADARARKRDDSIRIAAASATEKRIRDSITRVARTGALEAKTPAPSTRANRTGPVSSVADPATAQTAKIRIASRTPNSSLYINGTIHGLLSSAQLVTIPAGVRVNLSIRAVGCAAWDTTIVVEPESINLIGFRRAKCD